MRRESLRRVAHEIERIARHQRDRMLGSCGEHAYVRRIDDSRRNDSIRLGSVEALQQQHVTDAHVFEHAEEAIAVRGDTDVARLADMSRSLDAASAAIQVFLAGAFEDRYCEIQRRDAQNRFRNAIGMQSGAVVRDALA